MQDERGPRSVLWVVVVATWAWGKGLGWAPAAWASDETEKTNRHLQEIKF